MCSDVENRQRGREDRAEARPVKELCHGKSSDNGFEWNS
jgi:hypothetical protein